MRQYLQKVDPTILKKINERFGGRKLSHISKLYAIRFDAIYNSKYQDNTIF